MNGSGGHASLGGTYYKFDLSAPGATVMIVVEGRGSHFLLLSLDGRRREGRGLMSERILSSEQPTKMRVL